MQHANASQFVREQQQRDQVRTGLMDDIRGQEKGKRIKMGPSLAGGGEREESDDGGSAGDNLPGNRQHPLLNELVMEVLFKQFSLLNHDESPKSALTHLAELRRVCKTWNHEIGKIIRKETRINVKKLISAYPKGLGWTVTTNTTEDPNNMTFNYSAPMPEAIGRFENLAVSIKKCEHFTKTSLLKWFQVMGSTVKSLHLTCALKCYHPNRFVEKILKEWCPNLRSFTLRGVECMESLIQNSFFAEPSLENQCRSLKECILIFDRIISKKHWSETCGLRIEDLETPGRDQKFADIAVRKKVYKKHSVFVDDLLNYLDEVEEAATSVAQKEEKLLNKLVRRPIGLTSLDGMTPRTFGSHVAPFFQGKFSFDPGYENDGGIIGQLMKMSKVERFVIQKLDTREEWFFNELFAMFFYRPNLWSSSVHHFECLDHCPALASGYDGENDSFSRPDRIFSRVGFPLKRLKFADWSLSMDDEMFYPTCMELILRGCAETLEELEFGVDSDDFYCHITIPEMPKLKGLVVETNGNYLFQITAQDILRKLPKLERCVLKLGEDWVSTNFFAYGLSDGPSWGAEVSHPLKEFKLLDVNVVERDIERLVMCFPNLKIVDLSIGVECVKVFVVFWERMGELPLEQVKLSCWTDKESRENVADDLYEKAIEENIEGFKDLQWLELELGEDGAEHLFRLTSRLSKGIAKAPKLRVLKFTNCQVDDNEAEVIKKNLPDVVVQLTAKKSSTASHEH